MYLRTQRPKMLFSILAEETSQPWPPGLRDSGISGSAWYKTVSRDLFHLLNTLSAAP